MTATPTTAEAESAIDPLRTPWRMARRRFKRNRIAVIGLAVLLFLILTCYASMPYSLGHQFAARSPRYEEQHLSQTLQSVSSTFPCGTDQLGRDILARMLLGGAISLAIGLSSAAISVIIGTTVGLVAGYVGGRTDAFLMRTVDVLYGLPYILLVILLRVAVVDHVTNVFKLLSVPRPQSWANIIVLLVGIGGVSWLTMARVIRGQVLSLRQQPFVEAARAIGLDHPTIIRKHLLPNLFSIIIVYATLAVPGAIMQESFLSFLGLGVQDPLPSWGNMASDAVNALNPVKIHWMLVTWPLLALSLTLLCLNFLGDGLREALDPKSRT
jgi:oligopeptide transport system permease protein